MLTIGIASYRNPDKLRATIASIRANTVGEYRLVIVHNPSEGDEATVEIVKAAVTADYPRTQGHFLNDNEGYAGAVNFLIGCAMGGSNHLLYCDNDIEVRTPGWNLHMVSLLDAYPEIGMVMPGRGHKPMHNGRYHECFWAAGFCWALRIAAVERMYDSVADWGRLYYGKQLECAADPYDPETGWAGPYKCEGLMDRIIGHHEEVDYQMRLRMAGYRIATAPEVDVLHHESSTRSKESEDRIHDGVVRWMNKWNCYFVGEQADMTMALRCERGTDTKYGDDMIQMDAWNCCGPYLNRFYQQYLSGLNANAEVREIPNNGPVDLIRVPRPHQFYRNRLI